jgi:Zn-dependent peptidase ImmA (M78 family)/DNA-binding XRE family transcriptional regulator
MLNPERVELVRLRLGLTKIGFAELLGVDRKVLQRFENGTAEFPENCLENLCSHSGYPIAFFHLPTPEYPNPNGVSFRSLRSLTASSRDAAIAAGALAFELDDWVADRYELPEHSLIQTENLAPPEAAAFLRAHWGIGVRPVGNMINFLESHGVRIFSLVEETRHLDAYSLWRKDRPYIFLNTLKTTERSRYDAAHELGHLVMHRHSGPSRANAEHEADAFASAFLMPPEDLKAEIPWVRSMGDLVAKKQRWGVSVAALSYALHKLEKITDWHYRNYCIVLGKLGRNVEPYPLPRETSQIWSKVLTDLWGQGISLSRIAERLAIPERELNDLLFGIATTTMVPVEGGKLRPVT